MLNPNKFILYNLAEPSIDPSAVTVSSSPLAILKTVLRSIVKLSFLFDVNFIGCEAVAKSTFSCIFSKRRMRVRIVNSVSPFSGVVSNVILESGLVLFVSKVAAIF